MNSKKKKKKRVAFEQSAQFMKLANRQADAKDARNVRYNLVSKYLETRNSWTKIFFSATKAVQDCQNLLQWIFQPVENLTEVRKELIKEYQEEQASLDEPEEKQESADEPPNAGKE